MKKTIIILFTLLVTLSCSKKEKRPTIDGLFDLRLGMTVNELKGVVDTTLLQETEFSFRDWTGEALREKQLKRFHLSQYVLDENYAIEQVDLDFMEGKLYSIVVRGYNEKTEELLTQKYGLINKDYTKVADEWHSCKSWDTGNVFRIICGSTKVTNLDDTFKNYTLYIRDDKMSNQAFGSVKKYWREVEEKEQDRIRNKNQPLIDKL